VYLRHRRVFKSLRHLNGDNHPGTGGLASRARHGECTGALPEPTPCPAGGYSRETPSGRDRLLLGEVLAGGGIWGTVLPLPRKAIRRQQLGRAKDRDWAGGTGRAGRSRAGKRLAGFFIGGVLFASNGQRDRERSQCDSHQKSSAVTIADSTEKSIPTAQHDVPVWIRSSRLATHS
jgi:hypothetical protein